MIVATFLRHGSNALLAAGIVLFALAIPFGFGAPAPYVALGVLLFFLSEYGTHRFLLHAPPSTQPVVLRAQHRLHYDHHLEPERLDLLFLPPWFLVPVLGLFALAYWLFSHNLIVVGALVFGNLLGLLYYEWVHYVAHIPFQPRTRFGRWIKKYHLWHHFKSERLWFGVTNPIADYGARTYRQVDEVERSGNTRVLFPK
ncbi:MAG TPA: sterol desaturase family protein [Candidatus Baltobacteraceae bacterium]|nr:sterol desaturase family protein [Candidatus Baltobacteraceae bacterium]